VVGVRLPQLITEFLQFVAAISWERENFPNVAVYAQSISEPSMKIAVIPAAVAAAFAFSAAGLALLGASTAHAQAQPAATAKQKITSADQLPRRTYTLPKVPSELVGGPLPDLMPLAEQLDKDLAADIAAFDIEDKATLRGMLSSRSTIAMLRGQWAEVPKFMAQVRDLQDKPGGRATSGVVVETIAQIKKDGGDGAAQSKKITEALQKRYSAMNWTDVQDNVKGAKGQFELANSALIVPSLRENADPVAKNSNMVVPAGLLGGIIGARVQIDVINPYKDAVVAALSQVIDANASKVVKPDIWSPRLVTLPANAKASPVVVGVWDSGVDMTLFKNAPAKGIAFDFEKGVQSPDLLRDLGDGKARWPVTKQYVQGAWDMRAALDTEATRKFKQRIATLKPEELKQFQEDMSAASLYTHGTHVAGIAVAGNPFAQVFSATSHWSSSNVPTKPSEELSRAAAANYQKIIDAFKANKVRVVNMSWRYGADAYEGALAYYGIGKDGEERKQMARKLFTIERDALKAAFESAPDILFVAGSGNEDNSADFNEYIPGGFSLPNLVTVGAVDQAGTETSFSTFGKTVVLHANGFEVESTIPGGERMKFSGASMSAPQVTNLAGKLFALNPKLTVAQVKDLIMKGAEKNGRVNLINPKKTIELAGLNTAGEE
jgi:subtilisin family serine protease